MLEKTIRKKRTVAAKCSKDEDHLKVEVSSIASCKEGELPDNPLKLQSGDPCPVCDSSIAVMDKTEEVET